MSGQAPTTTWFRRPRRGRARGPRGRAHPPAPAALPQLTDLAEELAEQVIQNGRGRRAVLSGRGWARRNRCRRSAARPPMASSAAATKSSAMTATRKKARRAPGPLVKHGAGCLAAAPAAANPAAARASPLPPPPRNLGAVGDGEQAASTVPLSHRCCPTRQASTRLRLLSVERGKRLRGRKVPVNGATAAQIGSAALSSIVSVPPPLCRARSRRMSHLPHHQGNQSISWRYQGHNYIDVKRVGDVDLDVHIGDLGPFGSASWAC